MFGQDRVLWGHDFDILVWQVRFEGPFQQGFQVSWVFTARRSFGSLVRLTGEYLVAASEVCLD